MCLNKKNNNLYLSVCSADIKNFVGYCFIKFNYIQRTTLFIKYFFKDKEFRVSLLSINIAFYITCRYTFK